MQTNKEKFKINKLQNTNVNKFVPKTEEVGQVYVSHIVFIENRYQEGIAEIYAPIENVSYAESSGKINSI